MKKKLIFVFIFLCCLFSIKSVYAETLPCTWLKDDFSTVTGITIKDFYQSSISDSYRIGDKVYVSFNADGKLDKNVDYKLHFKSTTNDRDLITVYLKGVSVPYGASDGLYSGYFVIPDQATVGSEYKYFSLSVHVNDLNSAKTYTTPSGTEVTTYDLFCGRFVFNEEDLEWHKVYNPSLLTYKSNLKTIKIVGEKKERVPANNVLKSISIDRNDVLAEGIMNFTVSVTEPVNAVQLGFLSPNGSIFTVPLLGSYGNNTLFTAKGNAPGVRFPLGTMNLVLLLCMI